MSEFEEEAYDAEEDDLDAVKSAVSLRYTRAELKPGMLAKFVASLTQEQRDMWTPIRQAWKNEVRIFKKDNGIAQPSSRDSLFEAVTKAQGKITAEEIEKGIRTGLLKGDPQAVRVMAQMAGIDLSDRPQTAAGEGAKVIIIRPHPLLLNAAEEADIQRQIAEH